MRVKVGDAAEPTVGACKGGGWNEVPMVRLVLKLGREALRRGP